MRHPEDLLRRYLDGELPAPDARALRHHLAECKGCRARLAALERLDARMSELDRLAPSRNFAARIQARVAALPPPRRPVAWRAPLALALTGLLALLTTPFQLLTLAGDMLRSASDTLGWAIALVNGNLSPELAGLGWGDIAVSPALVAGLCMLALASALILRQSLSEQLEV